ncbi:MAG: NUDIX domain-containing protein, partial [Acholeplasmataceae bacterium]
KAFKTTHFDLVRETVRGIVLKEDMIWMLYSEVLKDYTFPGGGIEPGEDHQEALRREILEETGMLVSHGKYIGTYIEHVYDFYDPSKTLKRINHYYVLSPGQLTAQQLTEEEEKYQLIPRWVAMDEAMTLNQQLIDSKTIVRDPYYVMKEIDVLLYLKELLNEKI